MKHRLVTLFLIAMLLCGPAGAQTPVIPGANFTCSGSTATCFKPPIAGVPLGFQQLSSLASATGLTVPAGAQEAFIVCTGQTVYWRDDGTPPTASIGIPLAVSTPFAYTGKLSAIQFIQSAASAICNVSYYQ